MQVTPQIEVTQPGQLSTRKTRNPNFALQGGFQPQGLYPAYMHPVLPGETLDRTTLKSTVVSAPLASPLAGAWLETWQFFVKLTDIDSALSEMFIGQLTDGTAYQALADQPRYFTKTGQYEWCKLATERIHELYFRDEGETIVMHPDGVPMIKRIASDPFESAVHHEAVQDSTAAMTGDTDGEEISAQVYHFMKMRQMGFDNLTYNDYLKNFGISQPTVAKRGEPELLSYRRYWTLPSNTIDPSSGAPTGAWYWRVDEKNEKPKRFTEPGFVIGYWAVRPKWLDGKLAGNYTSSLWGFEDWIPSYTLSDPAAGLRKIDIDNNPWITEAITGVQNIWFDHRDLLAHGEQFVNGAGRYTAPSANGRVWSDVATIPQLRGQYVLSTDLDALWTNSVTASGFDYDGIASLAVKGHVQDKT